MVLYYPNRFLSSIRKGVKLLFYSQKFLTCPPIVGNIKTNCLVTSSKYPIKYLELFFVSINFEITIYFCVISY